MKIIALLASSLLLVAGCASKEDIRQALRDNPDWVFEAIEKNPERFVVVAQEASRKASATMQAKAAQDQEAEREAQFKAPLTPEIDKARAIRGPADAEITLVEYSDFQCPYCARGYEVVEELRRKYGNRLRFVFKHLPLDFHEMAMPAARYFEAIALQSAAKAYKFHDEVFRNQAQLSKGKTTFLDGAAKRVGADLARLKKDLESETVTARIEADRREAEKYGFAGTPGFIAAGVKVAGAYPPATFIEIIDRRARSLAKTPASDRSTAAEPPRQ